MSKNKGSKRTPKEERGIRESDRRAPGFGKKSYDQKPPRPRPDNKGEKR